jgi:hypothetical protein
MQSDCNLVLYDARKGKGGYDPSAATWASNTWTTAAYIQCYAEVGSDGALRVFKNGAQIFITKTARFSASVAPLIYVIQDDGNFVSYQCDEPYWASNTWTPGAGFKQIIPSLNPNYVHTPDMLEGFARGCFGSDQALCEEAAKEEIGFIKEEDLADN